MFDCPSCTRTFETSRGLRVHHASTHGTCLPNRTCKACNKEFYSEHDIKYCTDKCREAALSFAGEANPNFKGGKDSTECEICGSMFEYYPSEKVGAYCPECVQTESWQTPPTVSGENHPHWSGGKVSKQCEICEEVVERWPSGFTGKVVLCGQTCRERWLSEAFTGAGHPNWEGGDTGPYGKGWAAVRRAALERDEYQCQICGTDREALGRNPDVHHIVPVRVFQESSDHDRTDAHRMDNVITLCVTCHRRADHGRIATEELLALIDS